MIKLVTEPIDPALVYTSICSAFSGSVVFHYALVKKQACSGKHTSSIDYSANENTLHELEMIAGEIEHTFELEDILLVRRIGSLGVGDIISLVAASSPNSEDSFAACKYGISQLKTMSTITKCEKFENQH